MLEQIQFYYGGTPSSQMGIINVNRSGDLFNEPFVATRSIVEQKVSGNDKPYHMGIERDPLSFQLRFSVDKSWLENSSNIDIDLNAIARWICPDYYKPLYFTDNQDKIYYCMPINDFSWIHNGLSSPQGYLELTMRLQDSWVYSPIIESSVYDYSNNTVGGTELIISNLGDVDIYPTIQFTKIGDGDVTITNNSNGGQVFQFTGISDQEQIFIDCENEDIISSLPLTYRFSNFNDGYLLLKRGDNHLNIQGNIQIQFRYAYKFYR